MEKGTYSDPRCYACKPAVLLYRTSGRDPDIDRAVVISLPKPGAPDAAELPPR